MSRYLLVACCALLGLAALAETPGGVLRSGTTFVPLRYIAEWLGAKVDFNEQTRGITLSQGDHLVTLAVGSTAATVDGKATTLAAAAFAEDGTTFVPVRFVAEALAAQVRWDEAAQKAIITHPREDKVLEIHIAGATPTPATPIYRPNVTVLTADGPVKVVAITPTSVTLGGKVPALPAGAILFRGGDAGILRKVVSTKRGTNGTVLVATTGANLAEVFADTDFDVSMSRAPIGYGRWKGLDAWDGTVGTAKKSVTVHNAVWQVTLSTPADSGPLRAMDVVVTVRDDKGKIIEQFLHTALVVSRQYDGPGTFTVEVESKLPKWSVTVEEHTG